MSSILNALKKLDRKPAEKVEIRPLAQTLDTAKVIGRPRQDQRSPRRLYVVALVLTIAAGGMAIRYFSVQKPAPEINVPVSENAGVGTAAPNRVDHGASKPGGLGKKAPVAVDRGGTPPRAVTSVGRGQAPTATPDDSGNVVTRIEIAPAVDVHENIAPPAKTGDERQRREGRKPPRLDYSVLRLQAVTWAVDPRDRFALVDNTILRKGESVKGYVVDSIHEDHVVVRKGSEKWRVEFRLR